jgi:hypothetical protein
MSYAQYGTIEAGDFNTLVTGFANGAANTSAAAINTVWATGTQNRGYGQTAIVAETAGNTITATKWAALVSNTASAASHQNSSITSVTAPVAGGTITYLSAIPTNLTTIYNNRLNAVSQSGTTANTATFASTWASAVTFTHTVTFANGDAARYFFNSGGQLAITCAHPTGTGINLLLNNLASNVGTVVLSSPTSGTATISGTSYNGVTRVGGGGNTPTVGTNSGYYAWTTSNANVYYQTASTGPAGYLSTNINMFVKTNGTVGSNSDAGNVVTIYTVWDEIPNGLTVSTGSATTVTIRPPEVTNIGNTWGTISISGTSSGS